MTIPIHSPTIPPWRPRVTVQPHYHVALWLLISAALLALLIPGGPVENRDFSHIHPLILVLFNLFLTTLDLASLALLPFVLQCKRWAIRGAYAAGTAYLLVYALDLAGLFPRSPTAMNEPLASIEMLGLCVALALLLACSQIKSESIVRSGATCISFTAKLFAIAMLTLAAVAIVAISTEAAMTPHAAVKGPDHQTMPCKLDCCGSHRHAIH